MRPISTKVKNQLLQYEQKCQRSDEGGCAGRITWEHALTYKGQQCGEDWAILFICEYHHEIGIYYGKGGMDKDKHKWIALNQAPLEAFEKYYKADWKQKLKYLNSKYGEYKPTRFLQNNFDGKP